MIWLLWIVLLLLLLVCWLLITALQVEIDSRVPAASLQWGKIGHAAIWYEHDWLVEIQILFFRKHFTLNSFEKKKTKKPAGAKTKKNPGRRSAADLLKKATNVCRSFSVKEWQWALDTGDFARNAQLYPLNYIPAFEQHLHINFNGKNYFVLKLQNRAWKIIYALLR